MKRHVSSAILLNERTCINKQISAVMLYSLIIGGSDKVISGQTWPLGQPLVNLAFPFLLDAVQVLFVG